MKEKLQQTDIFSIENTEDVAPQPQNEFVLTTPVTQGEMELRAKNRARKDEDVPVMIRMIWKWTA